MPMLSRVEGEVELALQGRAKPCWLELQQPSVGLRFLPSSHQPWLPSGLVSNSLSQKSVVFLFKGSSGGRLWRRDCCDILPGRRGRAGDREGVALLLHSSSRPLAHVPCITCEIDVLQQAIDQDNLG